MGDRGDRNQIFLWPGFKKIQYNMKNAASGRVGCYLQDDLEAKKP